MGQQHKDTCSLEREKTMTRRNFLTSSSQVALGLMLPSLGAAALPVSRSLNFYHTHTEERLTIDYTPGQFKGSVRRAVEYFLRDFRTGDIHPIDSGILDILYDIRVCCQRKGTFEVISGYRSARTNALLRKVSNGVAKRSYHMQGRAIDVRFCGLETDKLRDVAISLHDGGVGYYPESNFVHLDTGRKRVW